MFIFSLASILLPLFPLAMLFFRKAFHQHRMLLLIILCLAGFLRQILLVGAESLLPNTAFINAVFNITEMTILSLLVRSVSRNKWIRQALVLLPISMISAILTVYALEGITGYASEVQNFIFIFLILVSLIAVSNIISDEHILILQSPLFWILSGTLFYFAMLLLSEVLRKYELQLSRDSETERFILLAAVYMVRYVFYTIAAYMAPLAQKDGKSYFLEADLPI